MAKTTINNGDAGLLVRTAINNNFSEVYDVTTAYQSASGSFATAYEIQTSFSEPHNYIGTAPKGTTQNSTGWTIKRLTIASDGSVTKTSATGVWNNRNSLTYA